ncbi:hypothetical protein E4U55_002229 [Claviceps digitariae]|nr:hypothetical protein E4U55_002229 [Claviceps digitariae]
MAERLPRTPAQPAQFALTTPPFSIRPSIHADHLEDYKRMIKRNCHQLFRPKGELRIDTKQSRQTSRDASQAIWTARILVVDNRRTSCCLLSAEGTSESHAVLNLFFKSVDEFGENREDKKRRLRLLLQLLPPLQSGRRQNGMQRSEDIFAAFEELCLSGKCGDEEDEDSGGEVEEGEDEGDYDGGEEDNGLGRPSRLPAFFYK